MPDTDYLVSTTLRAGQTSTEEQPGDVVERFRAFARDKRTTSPFHLLFEDGTESRPRTAPEIVDRLEAIVPRMKFGERLKVVSEDRERLRVFAIESPLQPVHDVPGTANVRLWVAKLREDWPAARLAGTCVCKDDSTDKCNGHRDCAACDDFDSWPNMIDQYEYLRADAIGPDKHGVSYLILGADGGPMRPTIWTYGPPRTFSSRGARPYTGDDHLHLHASFADGVCGIACKPSSSWPR